MLIVNKIFHVTVLLFLYLRSFCACTEENAEAVNDLVLCQEDKPQTHRTVREISREMVIHWSSLSQFICKDLRLKCFTRHHAQELIDAATVIDIITAVTVKTRLSIIPALWM